MEMNPAASHRDSHAATASTTIKAAAGNFVAMRDAETAY